MKKSTNKKLLKTIPKKETALIGGAGVAAISVAAAGVAGYFLWKNRESIKNFVGQYIDLGDSSLESDSSEDFESEDEEKARFDDESPSTHA